MCVNHVHVSGDMCKTSCHVATSDFQYSHSVVCFFNCFNKLILSESPTEKSEDVRSRHMSGRNHFEIILYTKIPLACPLLFGLYDVLTMPNPIVGS
jgi:hypothetical protein